MLIIVSIISCREHLSEMLDCWKREDLYIFYSILYVLRMAKNLYISLFKVGNEMWMLSKTCGITWTMQFRRNNSAGSDFHTRKGDNIRKSILSVFPGNMRTFDWGKKFFSSIRLSTCIDFLYYLPLDEYGA